MSLLFRLGYDVDVYWRSPEGTREHVAHYHASSIDWLSELVGRDPEASESPDLYMPGFRIRARDLLPLLLEGPPSWEPMRSAYGVVGGPVDTELAERIPDDDWLSVSTVDTS